MNNDLKSNIRHAILFSSIGIALMIAGGLMIMLSIIDGSNTKSSPLANQCIQELRANGFQVENGSLESLEATNTSLHQVEANTVKASIAISRCVGYKLGRFCAGEGCEPQGISFNLVKVYDVVKKQ